VSRLPERSRIYQNHHFDSTRWNFFDWRDDDIVIATSYKAGTTWMQAIVANLLFQDGDFPQPVPDMSPWLDHRGFPLELDLANLIEQKHRRFIKTHLPLDGMVYRPQNKYVYVARDARDVFMSLWNHYTHHSEAAWITFDHTPGRVGDEFPRPPDDIHEFWEGWMTRGWFDWESDGYPYWSHLYSVQSWWDYKDLANIQLIHYADLKKDLAGEIRRIASFLEIDLTDANLERIAEATSFEGMKKKGETYVPGGGSHWEGGAETFLHKGTNGRWREVLSDEELALYAAACERTLSAECRAWMEEGGEV
jgi:aryl sulfotransferase